MSGAGIPVLAPKQVLIGGAGGTEQRALVGSDFTGLMAVVQTKATAYTLLDSDSGTVIEFTNATDIALTVPQNLSKGFNVTIIQRGAI